MVWFGRHGAEQTTKYVTNWPNIHTYSTHWYLHGATVSKAFPGGTPNLHFPHLHQTQIYTHPDLHETHIYTAHIYTNQFLDRDFNDPNIHNPNLHKTQIYTTQIYTKPKITQN